MITKRIIPRLDIKGPNLVKGIHLEGLRVVGSPWDFAQHYAEQGADELLFMDAVASLYGRNSLHNIIQRTAEQTFVPIAVGGGIRSLEDIRQALLAGADKIVINTAAIERPEFIREAANKFGRSTISVSIQSKKQLNGSYHAFCNNGRDNSGKNVLDWAQHAIDLGAGEIVLTSIDQDGTGQGYDLSLIKQLGAQVSVPLVCCGGAGQLSHLSDAVKYADGLGLASALHYTHLAHMQAEQSSIQDHAVEKSIAPNTGGFKIIQEQYFTKSDPLTIATIKQELAQGGTLIR